jgi:hypothetical protein
MSPIANNEALRLSHERSHHPDPPEPDAFDGIYDRMQDELNALLCVHAALNDPHVDADDGLSAARGLLHRTFRELDRLHSELETWHMRERAP